MDIILVQVPHYNGVLRVGRFTADGIINQVQQELNGRGEILESQDLSEAEDILLNDYASGSTAIHSQEQANKWLLNTNPHVVETVKRLVREEMDVLGWKIQSPQPYNNVEG